MDENTILAVSGWMAQNVTGFKGPISAVQKFDVGQSNPTFRIEAPSGTYVLRRKPEGNLLKSAHAVDREYRVQQALFGQIDCICKTHALCQDESVIGSDFYVMDFVDSRGFMDPTLPELGPQDRRTIADEMSRVLASIHEVDIDACGLSDFGPPGNYYERQLARWTKQYRASETESLPAMDNLISWLSQHLPPDDGQRSLVHGDFRLDNLLFDRETLRCVAVLDWELSTIGHPFADLASVIMQWQLPPGEDGRGLAGVDRAALGLPTDAEFVEAYCERRGIGRIANFGFFVAFAFFRMAAILQGVKKRALDGTASNPDKALRLGTFVPRFAELGLEASDT